MNIKVSVIIPIYNMGKYLKNCLDSILSQTLKEIEIICINDGSTDNTDAILREYSKKYSNIFVLSQEREGAGSARNKGIRNAKGDFLAFVDPDDYYPADDVLEQLLRGATDHSVQVAGGNCQIEFEGKLSPDFQHRFYEDKVISFDEYQDCIGFTKFIYDSRMIKENNILFPTYVRTQDLFFMLKALSYAEKIWAMTKDTYVVRAVDKKIGYNSSNVIRDFAKGLYDVVHFSKRKNYKKIIENIVREMEKRKIYFFLHILNGNEELYDCIRKINSDILGSGYRPTDQYYLDMTIKDIRQYMLEYSEWVQGYIEIMEEYEKIIIYGAGRIGKAVFDVIKQRDNLCFAGFAISKTVSENTARGERIYCIDKYIDMRDTALVIIAGEKRVSDEMERNAKAFGFKNRLVINKEIIDVDRFEINNDKFAV